MSHASNEYKLARVANYLRTALPGLSPAERAEIAVQATMTGGVLIDKEGELRFSDDARTIVDHARHTAVASALARTNNPAARAVIRERAAKDFQEAQRAATLPVELASVTGTDNVSKAQRAAFKERMARERLGNDE